MEGLCKVCAKGIRKRRREVAGRRDENRVIFRCILRGFLELILVGILLAHSLLVQDLHRDVRDGIQTWRKYETDVITQKIRKTLTALKNARTNFVDRVSETLAQRSHDLPIERRFVRDSSKNQKTVQ